LFPGVNSYIIWRLCFQSVVVTKSSRSTHFWETFALSDLQCTNIVETRTLPIVAIHSFLDFCELFGRTFCALKVGRYFSESSAAGMNLLLKSRRNSTGLIRFASFSERTFKFEQVELAGSVSSGEPFGGRMAVD
jgi:hypothetical protein